MLRPNEHAFVFLSWTSIALPIADILSTNSPLTLLLPVYDLDLTEKWDGKTALGEPSRWAWLPNTDDPPSGFSDWYEPKQTHYSSALDPLNQTNFEGDLLPSLRGKLGDVNIRHVVIILLESTRQDVFPFKKDGYMWKKLEETWDNQTIPTDVRERLATLTKTANFITGDYNDGFDHPETRRRGGIHAIHGTPSATYTLKSCAGTLCGISPLAVDGNQEYYSHIYQPCLPHIFKLFNDMDHASTHSPINRQYTGYRFRVPLAFSHPNLPTIEIQESVTAMSVVPTILDLLIETGSFSSSELQAARDLLRNYEGQSLIRSLKAPETASEQRWQFTAVSPGGQGVSVRSMDEPRWRLVVPLIEDLEWWFSDLDTDPHEEDPTGSFGFAKLLQTVEEKHGIEAAKWAEEAAFVTRWWVTENHERWRYNPE
ncbi:sulfatase domain protein, partial [Metarhizium majus ARSEF 297]